MELDVSRPEEIEAIFGEQGLPDEFRDVDVLVNNAKAAVRAFTDALRKELISTRIRIITVDPGQVLTEFNDIRHRFDKEKADKVYAYDLHNLSYDPDRLADRHLAVAIRSLQMTLLNS
ncbi:unnamed protein product [Alternaria alternata]